MRRAVISGVTGHVGQELAHQLMLSGVEVHGLTRQPVERIEGSLSGVRLHRMGADIQTLLAILDDVRPETVFHLAALARREHLSSDISPFVNANILLGTQLLEAARLAGCRKFITAGTYLQYTNSGAIRPFNLYAALKQGFESILRYFVEAHDMSAAILTLCNVYGERDMRPTLILDMASACAAGMPIILHASEAWIDPVHVEDVALAFVQTARLFERGDVQHGELVRYSVSSGREVNASDLIALFEKLCDRSLTVYRKSGQAPPRRPKPWRGPGVPGWTPRISLDQGLARILNHCRARAP